MPAKLVAAMTTAERHAYREQNRRAQLRWRQHHPERARELQRAKPSYRRHLTGEALGFGRPMTRAETGRFGALVRRGRSAA